LRLADAPGMKKVAPARGRGLKLEMERHRIKTVSRPRAGAWIETSCQFAK